jgi:hypothetical protein
MTIKQTQAATKKALTAAQKDFTAMPTAYHWRQLVRAMEEYQAAFFAASTVQQ